MINLEEIYENNNGIIYQNLGQLCYKTKN